MTWQPPNKTPAEADILDISWNYINILHYFTYQFFIRMPSPADIYFLLQNWRGDLFFAQKKVGSYHNAYALLLG